MIDLHHGGAVIVSEDHGVADDIRRILIDAGYGSLGVATTRSSAEALIAASDPDVVFVDADVDDAAGLAEATGGRPIVALVDSSDRETFARIARALRPAAIVVKPFSEAQLVATVATILDRAAPETSANEPSGEFPTVAYHHALRRVARVLASVGMVADDAPQNADRRPAFEGSELLSPREREVVEHLISHRRVWRVARVLHISEHTVRNHLKSIFCKLDVHSQDELLDRAIGKSAPAMPFTSRFAPTAV